LKLLSGNNVDEKKWRAFLNDNQYSSPFQSPEFYELFNHVPGLLANVYAIENDQQIKSLCVVTLQKDKGIKGFFSRRAIIYGGPILSDNAQAELAKLLEFISNDLKGRSIYIETRNFFDYSIYKNTFAGQQWKFDHYLNYHLNCSTEIVVQENLNTNRKRQIKKAFKNGAVIAEAKNINEVNEFYLILEDLYKNKIKKPLLPMEFFQAFFEKDIGKILLVKKEEKIIGGIVCPILRNKAIYELYICGLDHDYKDLSPSVMATYAAIEYGFNNNLKKFDFMGAGKPSEDYGVRDFKAKFGGELVEHGRFVKINNQFLYGLGKTALKVIQKVKK